MSANIIDRLFTSLTQLEEAISQTKVMLASMSNPKPELIERLRCYEEVLRRQRVLAGALEKSVVSQNWEQVSRHVDLIRGSSLLIQLDSQSLISEMKTDDASASILREFND